MAMNLFKGVIALGFMGMILSIEGFASVDMPVLLVLALSGLIGIFLGDTLYFLTLVRLGPRLTLLLGTLIPITAAFLAVLFLGERVSPGAWVGIALTLLGVTYVLWDKAPEQSKARYWRSGLVLGLIFVVANATGIILTKIGVENLSAMQASFIRSSAALFGLFSWGLATAALGRWVSPLRSRRMLMLLLSASLIGAFFGTWLSVVALKYTDTAIAATLNSTSPVFILPLAAIFLKERISVGAIIGTVLAVSGIGIYFSTI